MPLSSWRAKEALQQPATNSASNPSLHRAPWCIKVLGQLRNGPIYERGPHTFREANLPAGCLRTKSYRLPTMIAHFRTPSRNALAFFESGAPRCRTRMKWAREIDSKPPAMCIVIRGHWYKLLELPRRPTRTNRNADALDPDSIVSPSRTPNHSSRS